MKTIKIKGMSCQHCVMAVTKALSGIDGIENVKVDLDEGSATYDETKSVDMEKIKSRVEESGYEVG